MMRRAGRAEGGSCVRLTDGGRIVRLQSAISMSRRNAGTQQSRRSEVVRAKGLEPPHPFGYRDLNPARLPVPPRSRA
jgi:hypothetical protein